MKKILSIAFFVATWFTCVANPSDTITVAQYVSPNVGDDVFVAVWGNGEFFFDTPYQVGTPVKAQVHYFDDYIEVWPDNITKVHLYLNDECQIDQATFYNAKRNDYYSYVYSFIAEDVIMKTR